MIFFNPTSNISAKNIGFASQIHAKASASFGACNLGCALGPELRKSACLLYSSIATVFKLCIIFEQGASHFHSALGLTNDVAHAGFDTVCPLSWSF